MMVDTLRVAILGSLNCMLSTHHLGLRLGHDIEDAEVPNGIEGVSNLIL
jgi:hypothetical protein